MIDVEALAQAIREEQKDRTEVCEPYTGRSLFRRRAWTDETDVLREAWRDAARKLIAKYDRLRSAS